MCNSKTMYLFFCGYCGNRKELQEYLSSGVLTHLTVSYSRVQGGGEGGSDVSAGGRYVQDKIQQYCVELASWMMEESAAVYVCG